MDTQGNNHLKYVKFYPNISRNKEERKKKPVQVLCIDHMLAIQYIILYFPLNRKLSYMKTNF